MIIFIITLIIIIMRNNIQYKSCDNFFFDVYRIRDIAYCKKLLNKAAFDIIETRALRYVNEAYNITRDSFILRLLLQSHDALCISFRHLMHVCYVCICIFLITSSRYPRTIRESLISMYVSYGTVLRSSISLFFSREKE